MLGTSTPNAKMDGSMFKIPQTRAVHKISPLVQSFVPQSPQSQQQIAQQGLNENKNSFFLDENTDQNNQSNELSFQLSGDEDSEDNFFGKAVKDSGTNIGKDSTVTATSQDDFFLMDYDENKNSESDDFVF